MKKVFIMCLLVCAGLASSAQLALTKYVGKNAKAYNLGFGAFLKGGYSFNGIDDVTAELGVNFFTEKEDNANGIANVPFKLGYRYKLNRSPAGLYVEPQVGYNFYGVSSYYNDTTYENIDIKYNGIVLSPGVGYIFKVAGSIQPNVELRYDTNITPSGPYSWVSLRLTFNWMFNKKAYQE